jgi:hypothetical protein
MKALQSLGRILAILTMTGTIWPAQLHKEGTTLQWSSAGFADKATWVPVLVEGLHPQLVGANGLVATSTNHTRHVRETGSAVDSVVFKAESFIRCNATFALEAEEVLLMPEAIDGSDIGPCNRLPAVLTNWSHRQVIAWFTIRLISLHHKCLVAQRLLAL